MFSLAAEGKIIDLQEIFAQSMEFFEKLKTQLQTGSPEEKKEAVALMGEMYSKMMGEVKKISEKTGLTEEQLMTFAENPNNFTQDQWKVIKEAKDKISKTGVDLARIINADRTAELPSSAVKKEGVSGGRELPKKKPSSKTKKSGWIRS